MSNINDIWKTFFKFMIEKKLKSIWKLHLKMIHAFLSIKKYFFKCYKTEDNVLIINSELWNSVALFATIIRVQ